MGRDRILKNILPSTEKEIENDTVLTFAAPPGQRANKGRGMASPEASSATGHQPRSEPPSVTGSDVYFLQLGTCWQIY